MKKITCINNTSSSKYFNGKQCNNSVFVSDDAQYVLCWACVIRLLGDPVINKKPQKTGFPRGWKFMNEYVDKDGNVYHKGIEQPHLKNTLKPTKIQKIAKTTQAKKTVSLEDVKKIKKQIKLETNVSKRKKLQEKLNNILKEL